MLLEIKTKLKKPSPASDVLAAISPQADDFSHFILDTEPSTGEQNILMQVHSKGNPVRPQRSHSGNDIPLQPG